MQYMCPNIRHRELSETKRVARLAWHRRGIWRRYFRRSTSTMIQSL